MSTYLVVANQTVTNPKLMSELKTLRDRDPEARFVLLVPATPVRHLLFRREREDHAETVAREHAEAGRERFTEAGLALQEVRIGHEDPLEAIRQASHSDTRYVAVVLSTLPGDDSRWMKMQLPRRVNDELHLPVLHVEAPPTWTAGY